MRLREGGGTLKGREGPLYFATGNKGKFAEAARTAAQFGVKLKQVKRRKVEIQSDVLKEIARFAAKEASEDILRAVVAEDSGFFVHALDGFPGPYSSYVYRTIGNEGILRLMKSVTDRTAHFQAVVAFCRPGKQPVCFSGIVKGTIGAEPKGRRGFGFDPIFVPGEGDGRTFAQMSVNEKNMLSHRGRAFLDFFNWFTIRS
ncbi:MAG TPA: XTP/dITP diphosphatase [archaeon]|nr:XTP/dITP diphosphatase [archaeon]